MDSVMQSAAFDRPRTNLVSRIREAVRAQARRRAVFVQTRDELTMMTDRELNDIGLSRAMIGSVAKAAARMA